MGVNWLFRNICYRQLYCVVCVLTNLEFFNDFLIKTIRTHGREKSALCVRQRSPWRHTHNTQKGTCDRSSPHSDWQWYICPVLAVGLIAGRGTLPTVAETEAETRAHPPHRASRSPFRRISLLFPIYSSDRITVTFHTHTMKKPVLREPTPATHGIITPCVCGPVRDWPLPTTSMEQIH